jgi:hypothetical protein
VKARFDYGAMIFILTFSLVLVSDYRYHFEAAYQRIYTVLIGTVLCIIISMFVFPIWAGKDLHALIFCNIDKLADSLEGECFFKPMFLWSVFVFKPKCRKRSPKHINKHTFFKYSGCVTEYFKDGDDLDEGDKECHKKLQGYKSVLSSKAREDSLVSDRINASNFKGWLDWWKPETLSIH